MTASALALASCGGSKEEAKKEDAGDATQEAAAEQSAEQSPAEEALPSDTIVAKEQ